MLATNQWYLVGNNDSRARALADRHYSRQNPGSSQFCPPGNKICLIVPSSQGAAALWVSQRPDPASGLDVRKDGFTYWSNPYFRNESRYKSSDLIREAVAITCYLWGDVFPCDGFHSFVNPDKVEGVKVRGKIVYGFCFLKAGFTEHPIKTKTRHLLRLILDNEKLIGMEKIKPLSEQLSFVL
jgi:hypothetical protein